MSPVNELGERLEELSSDDREHIRSLCKSDLYFFSKAILGYNQLCESAHAALCSFMVNEKRNRRMVLMPRGHLKTTICTISDSIRLSLINPNVRVLIQNEVFENAADILSELKDHWVKNQMLRSFFPELVPERFSGSGIDWARDGASIVRTRNAKESTYTASGSGGSPQSKHFEYIKNDDLIGERQRTSELEMQRSISWADAMTPLLDAPSDVIDFYGTRKTMADVYTHTMEKYKNRLAVFVREPIENGVPIFPKYSLEDLLYIMNETPEVWAYDFMNNPVGKGGLDWGRGLLRTYALVETSFGRKIQYEDHLTGQRGEWDLRELDVVITTDPNSGKTSAPDKAAVIVHGVSPDEQIFVLDTWSDRVSPDGLIDAIWDRCQRWSPRVVGIEEAGQQNTIYYFEKRCHTEQVFYRIQPLYHYNKQKETKIRQALDSTLKARRLYVLPSQATLIGQIQLFPQLAAHNWDEIDALSYGPQLYQKGLSLEDMAADEEAETKVLELRGITGYGVSVG